MSGFFIYTITIGFLQRKSDNIELVFQFVNSLFNLFIQERKWKKNLCVWERLLTTQHSVMNMEDNLVAIVGAGPSGLATAACLNSMSIPNIILEKEDCCASLWKKRTYDRLKLHLAKRYCALPLLPHQHTTPKYMSKGTFVCYLDDYASRFNIKPRYNRSVEHSFYDEKEKKWRIEAKNTVSGEMEVYVAKFLVVATGENSQSYIPEVPGLESFEGEIVHASQYKSGSTYARKEVLVVGCGNSGMEISRDLSDFGAQTSILIRSPVRQILTLAFYLN